MSLVRIEEIQAVIKSSDFYSRIFLVSIFVVMLLPPQGASATEEAVIASRVDIGLESRNFVVVAFVVAQAYP